MQLRNVIRGAGTVCSLRIAGQGVVAHKLRLPKHSDTGAISADWARVGQDIRWGMEKIRGEFSGAVHTP